MLTSIRHAHRPMRGRDGERIMMESKRWLVRVLALGMSTLGLTDATHAATGVAPDATPVDQFPAHSTLPPTLTNDFGSQDIIVTAQNRSQTLLDVPVYVTALTSAQLVSRGINFVQDIIKVTPGLTFADTDKTERSFHSAVWDFSTSTLVPGQPSAILWTKLHCAGAPVSTVVTSSIDIIGTMSPLTVIDFGDILERPRPTAYS